jgi:ketosteroid isomerase-like protein
MKFEVRETVHTTDLELVLRALEMCSREVSSDVVRYGDRITLRGFGPSPRAKNVHDTTVFCVNAEDGKTVIAGEVTFQASALLGDQPQDEVVRSKIDDLFELMKAQITLDMLRAKTYAAARRSAAGSVATEAVETVNGAAANSANGYGEHGAKAEEPRISKAVEETVATAARRTLGEALAAAPDSGLATALVDEPELAPAVEPEQITASEQAAAPVTVPEQTGAPEKTATQEEIVAQEKIAAPEKITEPKDTAAAEKIAAAKTVDRVEEGAEAKTKPEAPPVATVKQVAEPEKNVEPEKAAPEKDLSPDQSDLLYRVAPPRPIDEPRLSFARDRVAEPTWAARAKRDGLEDDSDERGQSWKRLAVWAVVLVALSGGAHEAYLWYLKNHDDVWDRINVIKAQMNPSHPPVTTPAPADTVTPSVAAKSPAPAVAKSPLPAAKAQQPTALAPPSPAATEPPPPDVAAADSSHAGDAKQEAAVPGETSHAPAPSAADSASSAVGASDLNIWLQEWAAAMRTRDASAQAAFYADSVDRYLDHRNVTRDAVLRDRESTIHMRKGLWTVKIEKVSIIRQTGSDAEVHLVKHFIGEPEQSEIMESLVPTRLLLKRVGKTWRITSEEDLR